MVALIFDVSEVTNVDLVLIIEQGVISRLKFFPWCTVSVHLLYPRELFHDGCLPFGAFSGNPFLGFLRVELEDFNLLVQNLLGLFLKCRNLVHIVIVAVVALLSGIFNSLLKSGLESITVRKGNAKKRIVLLEGFDLLNVEALLLEDIFLLLAQATEVRVKRLAQLAQVLLSLIILNDHLV